MFAARRQATSRLTSSPFISPPLPNSFLATTSSASRQIRYDSEPMRLARLAAARIASYVPLSSPDANREEADDVL